MTDRTDVLEKFDSLKLIDIAKNYRQYGYEEEIQRTATKILENRGFGEIEIDLAGVKSGRYDAANAILKSYKKNAKLALFFYFGSILLRVGSLYIIAKFQTAAAGLLVVNIVFLLAFLITLFRSFIDQKDFYSSIGKEFDLGDQSVFVLLGVPFYFYFYFHYRNRMKEELQ